MTRSSTPRSGNGGPRWFTFGRLRGGHSLVAAQILAFAFIVGFALPMVNALVVLIVSVQHDGGSTSPLPPLSVELGWYLVTSALSLLAAVLGFRTAVRCLRLCPGELGLHGTASQWRRAPAAAAMYVALLAATISVTLVVLGWLGIHGTGVTSGVPPGPGVLPVETIHNATAGLDEEPILLALALALAGAGRWRWPVTLTVLIALRISFHLYYGWDCLFVLPWILGAVLLYRWCPLVWPFVIAHSLFDLTDGW